MWFILCCYKLLLRCILLRVEMLSQSCTILFIIVQSFNWYSMCNKCTWIHCFYANGHWLTDWLSYPKSRDAIASKKVLTICPLLIIFSITWLFLSSDQQHYWWNPKHSWIGCIDQPEISKFWQTFIIIVQLYLVQDHVWTFKTITENTIPSPPLCSFIGLKNELIVKELLDHERHRDNGLLIQ